MIAGGSPRSRPLLLQRVLPPLPPLEGSRGREYVLLAAVLVMAAVACYQPLWDPDTFWHLAVGREIWETGRLVHTETFSFTAYGTEWEDTEWAFHALAYPLWKALGDRGLSLLTALFGALVLLLVYRTVRLQGGNAAHFALYLLPMMLAYQGRIRFRPDLFSLLFMALLVEALLRWRPAPPEAGRFWITATALIWAWTQFHGGWAYGMALLGARLAGEVFDAARERTLTWRYFGGLAWTGLAPTLALFLNPYTWRIPWFPIKSLIGFADETLVQIQEWGRTPFKGYGALFLLACLLVLGSLLARWREARWSVVLPAASQVFLGWYWARYAAFTVIALAPWGAGGLRRLLRRPALERWAWSAAFASVLCAAVFFAGAMPSEWNLSEKYPVQEVKFLNQHGVTGNLFNEYVAGGYLDWAIAPRCRIFMDGRYYPFAADLQAYWKAHNTLAGYRDFLARYPFEVILYPHPGFLLKERAGVRGSPLRGPTALLFPQEEWALVHFGNYGMVLLKRIPRFEALIARFEYRVLRPDDLPHLMREAKRGELDPEALRADILRKIAEDPYFRRRDVLDKALAELEGQK
ncbi:MAG: hypothetical protein ACOYXN_01625 [Acidobacteriota bacterium]